MCKLLIKYLQRLVKQLNDLLEQRKVALSAWEHNRLETINKLFKQQWKLYFGKEAKVPDRIVSLHKPYVRPIVRQRSKAC